jgi:hypothetical protein
MRRRDFAKGIVGSAAAWPLAARAQRPALPVVGFIRDGTADASARYVTAFRQGLSELGVVEGQNVTVEYHWLEGRQSSQCICHQVHITDRARSCPHHWAANPDSQRRDDRRDRCGLCHH